MLLALVPGYLLAETITQEVTLEFDSEVFARQGDAVITQKDFDAYLDARVPEEDRKALLSSADHIGQILENIMLTRMLAADGINEGLLEDSAVRAAAYQAVMRVLAEKQRAAFWEAARLDDYSSQAQERYILNKERYQTEETIDFTHLLVSTRERSSSEALEKITGLAERIEAGEELDELARSYSDDPSYEQNRGLFEGVKRDDLDQEFAAVAFDMEPGKVSGPVASEHGWHLVRVEKINPPRQKEFEEVRSELIRRARQNHRDRTMDRYLSELVSQELDIAEGAVQKLLDRHGTTLPAGHRVTGD